MSHTLVESEQQVQEHLSLSDKEHSLEYIEDPYFQRLEVTATPSLDETFVDDDELTIWDDHNHKFEHELDIELYLRSLTLDQILDSGCVTDVSDSESQSVQTEFVTRNVNTKLRLFTRKAMKDVKVTFQDLSKPYLAKMSTQQNYRKFLNIVGAGAEEATPNMTDRSPSGDSGVGGPNELLGLSPEEVERQKAEWTQELARVEDEIATLREVLASKVRHSAELKRKLGISVWREISEDMNQGIKTVKESHVYQNVEHTVESIAKAVVEAPIYQKTESVIKNTAEKTTSLFGDITAGVTSKFGQMRNSESFRSLEERVGSAYENVKTKVSTSRSSSMQSFDEALQEANKNPSTTPTIPEHRPFS